MKSKKQKKLKSKKQEKWYPKLYPIHRHYWKKAYKKLLPKLSRLRHIWGRGIEGMIHNAYGNNCPYCGCILDVKSIGIDHIYPESLGGESKIENAGIMCKRCNRRKGQLNAGEYIALLDLLDGFSEEGKAYVLRKLSSKDMFGK